VKDPTLEIVLADLEREAPFAVGRVDLRAMVHELEAGVLVRHV
jgi:hypothetical protein